MAPSPNDVTRLLDRIRCGDDTAADRLLPLVYEHLRGLVTAIFSAGGRHNTLSRPPWCTRPGSRWRAIWAD
jgi:hypothetical protein